MSMKWKAVGGNKQLRGAARLLAGVLLGALLAAPQAIGAEKRPTPVTVVNTPTVSVQQSGKWMVGLNDTPTVKVSAPPATIERPILDSFVPYVKTVSFNIESGTTQNNASIPIPEGKRLIIEFISARAQGPAGQKFIAQIQTSVARTESPRGIYWLVFFPQGSFSTIDVFTASQPTHIFAEPGYPPVQFVTTRTSLTGTAFVEATITGHLVTMPK
jgi:hypothetical protein